MAAKKRRSGFVGPVGDKVNVEFSRHSLGRLIERFTPVGPKNPNITADMFESMDCREQEAAFYAALDAGLPYEAYVSGIQNPNMGREDEISSSSFGYRADTRYCRWFRPVLFGKRMVCQIVFVIEEPTTEESPGSIRVITVYPPMTS